MQKTAKVIKSEWAAQ